MGDRFREPAVDDVREAARSLEGVIYQTPLIQADGLAGIDAAAFWLKAENLQRTGSFKLRGAYNFIRQLTPDEKRRGVIAVSAGNHAQGVALAARLAGVQATVVMPAFAPMNKVENTKRYGAQIELVGRTFDEAQARVRQLQEERGSILIHPFDDPRVIAGQGTVALEVLAALPDLDLVLVPVGGGGLISGMALTIKALRPSIRVVGVQAAGAASYYRSRQVGTLTPVEHPKTIADGLAIKTPSQNMFALIERYVDDLVLVDDDEIAAAILALLERRKLLVEGAGAVAVAAAMFGKLPLRGKRVLAVISGGNIDVTLMARIIERGLVKDGRYLRIITQVQDRPGELLALVEQVARAGGNIVTVAHERLKPDVALDETEVALVIETRDAEHAQAVRAALREAGFRFQETVAERWS